LRLTLCPAVHVDVTSNSQLWLRRNVEQRV